MSSKSHARGRSIGLTRVSSSIGFCRETVAVRGLREGVIGLFFHSRGFGCVGLFPNGLRAPTADTWIGLKQYDHVWLFIPQRVHCCAFFRSSAVYSFFCLLGLVVALDSSRFLFPPPLSFDPLP